jgi:hypothetical protein
MSEFITCGFNHVALNCDNIDTFVYNITKKFWLK